MNRNQADRLLSKADVAGILSLSVRSVERLVARGLLKNIKIGGVVRFRPSEIEKLIEEGEWS